MKVLKATNEQKKVIENQTKGIHIIKFVVDKKGNYIIGKQILNDSKFSHLHYDLQQLEEIDYNPILKDEV